MSEIPHTDFLVAYAVRKLKRDLTSSEEKHIRESCDSRACVQKCIAEFSSPKPKRGGRKSARSVSKSVEEETTIESKPNEEVEGQSDSGSE